MIIHVRNESVIIEGYVNAVERNSKPLYERGVRFVERIAAGAFARAIKAAGDVRALLNHDPSRDLGGIADGNLELYEDNIGLRARLETSDPQVVEDAKQGRLVGWSFGFRDIEGGVLQMRDEETGLPLRKVTDMILREVSLLNSERTPAYAGTLVNVRDDGTKEIVRVNFGDIYVSEPEITRENASEESKEGEEEAEEANATHARDEDEAESGEAGEDPQEPEEEAGEKKVSSVYYARYKNMIAEMRRQTH